MDEITARVMRTIASRPRLRILSFVSRELEAPPTGLSEQLGVPLDLVCTHLRVLTTAGLVQRRRSGTWCYCKAESPYRSDTLSGALALWLYAVLREPVKGLKDYGPVQVRNLCRDAAEDSLHGIIFDAATAFTQVRRLQLLRRLGQADAVVAASLMRELSMSGAAVTRHAQKLIRRGYVEALRVGRAIGYTLSREFKTPAHERMLQIVQETWRRE